MNRLTGYRSAAALVQKVVVALHPADAVVRLSILAGGPHARPARPGDAPRTEHARPARPRQSSRPQVVWYVEGAPFRVADYPYTVRWRLAPGEHVFQARLIDGRTASSAVRVLVQ